MTRSKWESTGRFVTSAFESSPASVLLKIELGRRDDRGFFHPPFRRFYLM